MSLVAVPLLAATPEDCRKLQHYGKLAETKQCYEGLLRSNRPADRAEGFWGLRKYQEANTQFKAAVAQDPQNAYLKVRWGLLFEERFNKSDAEDLFAEALKIDPKNAYAQYAMAKLASDGFEAK